ARANCSVTRILECFRITAKTGLNAASVASSHRPRSPGVIRPAGSAEVDSIQSMPAPERASWPRCVRCHEVALPSSAQYWHMGETTIRFGSVTPRIARGEKSLLIRTTSNTEAVLRGEARDGAQSGRFDQEVDQK